MQTVSNGVGDVRRLADDVAGFLGTKAGAGVKAVTSKTARADRKASAGAKRLPAKKAKRP